MDRRDFLKSGGLSVVACTSGVMGASVVADRIKERREIYVNSYVKLAQDLQNSAVIRGYKEEGSEVPSDFG